MKYPETCQKAKDKIDKIKENEQYFKDCLMYKICPKCGENLYVKNYFLFGTLATSVFYECEECKFEHKELL